MFFVFCFFGCGGDKSNSTSQTTNQLPHISLAASIVVIGPNDVVIEANVSDIDGKITSYSWQQLAGLPVEVSNNTTSTLNFTAPNLLYSNGEQSVTFQLTVVDNQGGESTASVNVLLRPLLTVNAGDDQALFIGESAKIGYPSGDQRLAFDIPG